MKRARRLYRPDLMLTWHWRPADTTGDVPGLHQIVPGIACWQRINWLHARTIELPGGWRREARSSRTNVKEQTS